MRLSLSLHFLLIIVIITINPNLIFANFFPNITSIPSSLIPNATVWDGFKTLAGCKKGVKTDGLAKLKKYFHHFGYIAGSGDNLTDDFDDVLESAVRTYQLNFNLDSTGQLDVRTLQRIVLPRCGNPDVVNGTSAMRRSGKAANSTVRTVWRYSFFPDRPRWPSSRRRLTYAFPSENRLTDAVRSVFARAFERWSEATTLEFVETAEFGAADVRIGFYRGDHGDGEAFDGVLGSLAHAFSPPAGICHLDADENWVIDGDFLSGSPFSAVDLESVAVHEIGHLLGLGHSSVEEAVMYPTISSGTRKVELANDDVMGIQELYGSNPNYNGSGPGLTPTGERDTSGSYQAGYSSWWRFQLVGLLLSSVLLFV